MTIKLGINLLSRSVQRNINSTTSELGKVTERLSTGLRINRAVDDAAGLSIANSLNADKRVFAQGIRNLNDGASLVNIADGALDALTNITIRIEELAEQSANGTFSDTQRSSLQKEVKALQDELNRIVNSTEFNGVKVLTGLNTKTNLQGGYGLDTMLGIQIGAEQFQGGIEGFAGGTTRVSTSSSDSEGNNASSGAQISADGRYVVFDSTATNLITGDSNGVRDVFRKDLLTGEIISVSTNGSGVQGNGVSDQASISADGRYVVFRSSSSNLVDLDTNTVDDIFRKDLLTGEITRISTSSSGTQGNGSSSNASITADGRFVVYASLSTNLVAGDSNGQRDIFRKDLTTGETIRVSTSSAGSEGNATSDQTSISADGRFVLFRSQATNLVAGDTNAAQDIFRKDLLTGELIRVSTSSNGSEASGLSSFGRISADGRYAVFRSVASNLVSGDTNGVSDIFSKDLLTGEVLRVSTTSSGAEANGASYDATISADGRYVAFESNATNLVEGDSNGLFDIFRKDLLSGEIIRLNTTSSGGQSSGGTSSTASISANGRNVIFVSSATNLVSSDSNGASDIFLRDLTRTGIQEMSGMVVSNQISARYTLDLAKQYREELTNYRSKIGASSSRISTFLSTLDSLKLNYETSESRITDADIASDAAANVNLRIKQQVGASLLAQANLTPRIGLDLLEN